MPEHRERLAEFFLDLRYSNITAGTRISILWSEYWVLTYDDDSKFNRPNSTLDILAFVLQHDNSRGIVRWGSKMASGTVD